MKGPLFCILFVAIFLVVVDSHCKMLKCITGSPHRHLRCCTSSGPNHRNKPCRVSFKPCCWCLHFKEDTTCQNQTCDGNIPICKELKSCRYPRCCMSHDHSNLLAAQISVFIVLSIILLVLILSLWKGRKRRSDAVLEFSPNTDYDSHTEIDAVSIFIAEDNDEKENEPRTKQEASSMEGRRNNTNKVVLPENQEWKSEDLKPEITRRE